MPSVASLVTGAASGLGLEIARQLAQSGRSVIAVSRDLAKLRLAVTSTIENPFCDLVECLGLDISDEVSVGTAFATIATRGIELEFLFNVAGSAAFCNLQDITSSSIARALSSNVIGLILVTKNAIPVLQRNTATIVNVLSTSALVGRQGEALYCTAKWAARGFTEAIRAELTSRGIRVVAVYPGGMKTPFWRDTNPTPQDYEAFMQPRDVASQLLSVVMCHDSAFTSDITIRRPPITKERP